MGQSQVGPSIPLMDAKLEIEIIEGITAEGLGNHAELQSCKEKLAAGLTKDNCCQLLIIEDAARKSAHTIHGPEHDLNKWLACNCMKIVILEFISKNFKVITNEPLRVLPARLQADVLNYILAHGAQ